MYMTYSHWSVPFKTNVNSQAPSVQIHHQGIAMSADLGEEETGNAVTKRILFFDTASVCYARHTVCCNDILMTVARVHHPEHDLVGMYVHPGCGGNPVKISLKIFQHACGWTELRIVLQMTRPSSLLNTGALSSSSCSACCTTGEGGGEL
eukprot:353880-Chlamydomonas_euryale.AAC.6